MAQHLQAHAAAVELLTFDCYGTLIDWQSGIQQALAPAIEAAGGAWRAALFERYMEIEARLESGPYRSYREILGTVERDLLQEHGAAATAVGLADSLAHWPAFDDTPAALRGLGSRFRLGVLSNVDRDLFRETAPRLGVDLDLLVTAEDVRAYKPAHAHFERMLEVSGLRPPAVLHVAQSRYHDLGPCQELGLACVWINRYGQAGQGPGRPLAEFPDVATLAAALGVAPRGPTTL